MDLKQQLVLFNVVFFSLISAKNCPGLSQRLTASCYNIIIADTFDDWMPTVVKSPFGFSIWKPQEFVEVSLYQRVFILLSDRICVNYIIDIANNEKMVLRTAVNSKLARKTKAIILCKSNINQIVSQSFLNRVHYGNLYDLDATNTSLERYILCVMYFLNVN